MEYKRAPRMYFVLFDIEDAANQRYLEYDEKMREGTSLGLEIPPKLYESEGTK